MAKKKKRGAPTKKCPKCGAIQHARVAKCKKCSHTFIAKKKVSKKRVGTKVLVKRVGDRKKSKRRGRPPAAAGGSFSVADIQATQVLASRLGGAARAKQLLDALG